MANAISSFFQCYPSVGSLSRSVVQEGSGGKTVLTGAFSSLFVGAVLLGLTHLFQSLPMACLAAVIIVNLKSLFLQLHDFVLYFQVNILEWVSA
jgi:MFS superfamily sulfate permease-like transporter